MATSDRQQFKQVVAGSIGDLRTLSATNPLQSNGCVAQDAQRYVCVLLQAALAVNTNYAMPLAVLDRPVSLKSVSLVAAANITTNSNTIWNVGVANFNGAGSAVVLSTINSNTVANGGTGN